MVDPWPKMSSCFKLLSYCLCYIRHMYLDLHGFMSVLTTAGHSLGEQHTDTVSVPVDLLFLVPGNTDVYLPLRRLVMGHLYTYLFVL